MRTNLFPIKTIEHFTGLMASPTRALRFGVITAICCAAGFSVQAANVLLDSDLEAAAGAGGGTTVPNWTLYGASWGNYAAVSTAHGGSVAFKVFGQFTGGYSYSGIYQDKPSGPGAVYSADGWVFSPSGDHIVGGNTAWLEVAFKDGSGNNLALFRSGNIDTSTPTDTWFDMVITNQFNPSTFTLIGTTNSLTAPPGTASVRYQVVFQQPANDGGSLYFDDLILDQTGGALPPTVSNISPNGATTVLSGATTFSFTAASPSTTIPTSGVQVILNGVDVSSQLTFGGTASSRTVSYSNLTLNRNYTGTVKITDANNFTLTVPVRFDTFSPTNFVWEAEDFDFSGGQFIDNPTPSVTSSPTSYFGRIGVQGIDENETGNNGTGDGPENYRAGDIMSTDLASETPRPQFAAAGAQDYSVGWFNNGEWINYTRTFPAGDYTIYARVANGNGGNANAFLSKVTAGQGTTNQTTVQLGTFSFAGRGWSSYDLVPLTDAYGNIQTIHLSGQTTLRLTSGPLGGGVNVNFLMLAPARTDLPPVIANVYPDGAQPFQNTNKLSFTVSSANSTVSSGNVHVTLNGTDVSSQLNLTGSPSSWNVTLPLGQGTYNVVITATDAGNRTQSLTASFDTFSQSNLMIEAEDFDYNGGLFIDNPVPRSSPAPDSYFVYPAGDFNNAGIIGIDLTTPNNDSGEQFAYRPFESCGTQASLDYVRQKFLTAQLTDPSVADYNVGWWNGSTWLNYTRTFPTNNYYVYARMAGGAGGTYSLSLGQVTSGAGTSNQVTQTLGNFNGTGIDWQVWQWIQLKNSNGTPAVVSLGGTNTLKATSGGGFNANFYMFVPAPPPSANPTPLSVSRNGSNIVLSFATQAGHSYTVQFKSDLSAASWSNLNTVTGDGSVKSVNDPVGSKRFYRLSIQ
jgi:hypothetical protein